MDGVVAGTLETLPALAARENLRPPAMTIVGEVVKLRQKLGWYRPGALDQEEPSSHSKVART